MQERAIALLPKVLYRAPLHLDVFFSVSREERMLPVADDETGPCSPLPRTRLQTLPCLLLPPTTSVPAFAVGALVAEHVLDRNLLHAPTLPLSYFLPLWSSSALASWCYSRSCLRFPAPSVAPHPHPSSLCLSSICACIRPPCSANTSCSSCCELCLPEL